MGCPFKVKYSNVKLCFAIFMKQRVSACVKGHMPAPEGWPENGWWGAMSTLGDEPTGGATRALAEPIATLCRDGTNRDALSRWPIRRFA
jgi:hypothetical protein